MNTVKNTLRNLIAFSKQQQANGRRTRATSGKRSHTAIDEAYKQIIENLTAILGDDQDKSPKK
ncbi:MAG: hypothetical protein ACPG8W_24835 [Candidatus Promineifilaceae bacterium]